MGALMDETEQQFQRLIAAREPDLDLTPKDLQRLKQPVTRVRPDNIFTWHLNRHTVFEDETDPKLIRQRAFLRRVGRTEGARLTEGQIAAQEMRLGFPIPEPWRQVYSHFNGGWVHTLWWGDMADPRDCDIQPIAQSSHEYLALEDVGPLRDLMAREMPDFDWQALDRRLIALSCADRHAVFLDYRTGDDPSVWVVRFDSYADDPLDGWEQDEYTFRWPNMRVFFRGLYLQDRII